MTDHTPILSGALVDYTEWLLKQKVDMAGAPAELRGIFYNKLIGRLRDIYPMPELRSAIKPEDIIVSFKPPGYIMRLMFGSDAYMARPMIRTDILRGLNTALLSIDVQDFHDKFSYELSKVILDAKKCLTYGRQQAAG